MCGNPRRHGKGKDALTLQERKHIEKGQPMPRRSTHEALAQRAQRPSMPARKLAARERLDRKERVVGLFAQASAPIRWYWVGATIFYEVKCLGEWRAMKPAWD